MERAGLARLNIFWATEVHFRSLLQILQIEVPRREVRGVPGHFKFEIIRKNKLITSQSSG